MPVQLQVTQIHNGWLVSSPPEQGTVLRGEQPQQQFPVTHYCADYDEVISYIKKFFPIS